MTIKELREQKLITQKQLADLLGLQVGVISKYEQGTVKPPKKRLVAISEALGVPLSVLADSYPDAGLDELIEIEREPQLHAGLEFVDQFEATRLMLIRKSDGKCNLCDQDAPFEKDGVPFLKLEMLPPSLKASYPYVVLCPNCAERVYQLKEADVYQRLLAFVKNTYN